MRRVSRHQMHIALASAVGVGVAAVSLCSGQLAGSASAAPDSTPPVIATNANAGFVVGSVVSAADYTVEDPGTNSTRVLQYLKWAVTDNGGSICDFQLNSHGDDWENTLLSSEGYRTTPWSSTANVWNDDYDGQWGAGEDATTGFSMQATDCSGNSIKLVVWNKPVILQDDNYAFGDSVGQIAYAGKWRVVNCTCATGGTMRKTSAKGASFTYSDYWNRDDHLGLVMAKGPRRGAAVVYIDGVKRATIHTHAPIKQNRVIVYDKWMPKGTHTVRVVNRATSGHPRIDLDAVINN